MTNYVLRVSCKTPVALGREGFYACLDSVLLHRLCLLTQGDVEAARKMMPLERDGTIWRCGGGYDPNDRLLRTKTFPRPYKVYRRLSNDRNLAELADLDPMALQSGVNRCFGQETVATEYRYSVRPQTMQLAFRFSSTDPETVLRIMRLEPFLGPGHSVGLGEIDNLEITAGTENDPSWVYIDPLGRLTRPVPGDWKGFDGLPGLTALEPPYWSEPKVPAIVPYPSGVK
ncbi:hypothetical protein BAE30_13765 [Acidithiobacillus caldus]|uniref:Uncharacterized protein n=1 Tax=Acidithiobacillus caldus TaxID=33059 RepID=A0A1E7YSJ5_9PROT|nr:hypothetical protein BAE30_13765 [Acidithiobacillus caldus]